jgi:hypothetical protein
MRRNQNWEELKEGAWAVEHMISFSFANGFPSDNGWDLPAMDTIRVLFLCRQMTLPRVALLQDSIHRRLRNPVSERRYRH